MSQWPNDAPVLGEVNILGADGLPLASPAYALQIGAGLSAALDKASRVVTVTAEGSGGGVASVVAGDGIEVDDTDPANPIVSAAGAGAGLQVASITLTHAQILTLPAGAIDLIAAPGANKQIVPVNWAIMPRITTAYTNVTAGVGALWRLRMGNVTVSPVVRNDQNTGISNLLDGATWHNRACGNPDGTYMAWGNTKAQTVNAPLRLLVTNTGNYTGGTDTNVVLVQIAYYVMDVPA